MAENGTVSASVEYRAIYRDNDWHGQVVKGSDRARRGDWTTGTALERQRQYEALFCRSVMNAAFLADDSITYEGTEIEIDVAGPIDVSNPDGLGYERLALQHSVITGWMALMPGNYTPPAREVEHVWYPTADGWPLAAVLVAAAVIGAAAWVAQYHIDQAGQLANNQLVLSAKSRDLVATQDRIADLVQAHVEREEQAGVALPLDDATKQALKLLGDQAATVAAIETPKYATPTVNAAKMVYTTAEKAASAASVIPWLVAAGIGGYFLLKGKF